TSRCRGMAGRDARRRRSFRARHRELSERRDRARPSWAQHLASPLRLPTLQGTAVVVRQHPRVVVSPPPRTLSDVRVADLLALSDRRSHHGGAPGPGAPALSSTARFLGARRPAPAPRANHPDRPAAPLAPAVIPL